MTENDTPTLEETKRKFERYKRLADEHEDKVRSAREILDEAEEERNVALLHVADVLADQIDEIREEMSTLEEEIERELTQLEEMQDE